MCLHSESWLLLVMLSVRHTLSHTRVSLSDQYSWCLGSSCLILKQQAELGLVQGYSPRCTFSFPSELHTCWHVRVFHHLHWSPSPACQVHHLRSPREGWDTDARRCTRWPFPSLEPESDDMSAKMRQIVGEREREREWRRGKSGWRDLVLIKTSKAVFSRPQIAFKSGRSCWVKVNF